MAAPIVTDHEVRLAVPLLAQALVVGLASAAGLETARVDRPWAFPLLMACFLTVALVAWLLTSRHRGQIIAAINREHGIHVPESVLRELAQGREARFTDAGVTYRVRLTSMGAKKRFGRLVLARMDETTPPLLEDWPTT